MSIFWDFSNYDKVELLPCPIITTGTQDMGNGVYKLAAGTPLKKSTQAVSNDANADCVVAEDYFFIATKADQSKLVPVITKGYVDKALAEAAWGGAFTDAAVSALETAGVFLVDGALETGGGDPGYDVETVTTEILPEQTVTLESGGDSKQAVLELADGASMPWPDTLTVVFNGDEYELTGEEIYGFASAYEGPGGQFVVLLDGSGETPVAGVIAPSDSPLETVTISATTTEEVVTVTDDFKDAVDFCTGYSTKTDEEVIIPEQTVSVTPDDSPYAMLTLAEGVDAPPESLTVVLDSVEHTTTATDLGEGTVMYMADDESFDVVIGPTPGVATLFAVIEGPSLSGSITVEASTTEEVVIVTDYFKAAVAAAGGSGGGDVFAVNFTYDGAGERWVCDKTYDEVNSALRAGQNVIGFCITGTGDYDRHSYSSFEAQQTELGPRFYFRYDNGLIRVIKIAGNGNISTNTLPGDRLVVISSWSSDAGKYVLEETWESINNAYAEEIPVYIHEFDVNGDDHGFFLVNGVRSIDTGGGVYAYLVDGFNPMTSNNFGSCGITYSTDSEGGYPAGNYPVQ